MQKRVEKTQLKYRLPGENQEVLQVIEQCEREIAKWQGLYHEQTGRVAEQKGVIEELNEKVRKQLAQERINFRNQSHFRNQSGSKAQDSNPTVYA